MAGDKPLLVILAAGRGSRFGGLKQLEPVGPGGGAILDYTVFDALRAGFGGVVLVVGEDSEERMRAAAGGRFGRHLPVDFVRQRLDDLPAGVAVPAGRDKPWGTGQAVLAAREAVDRADSASVIVQGLEADLGAKAREIGELEEKIAMLNDRLTRRRTTPTPRTDMPRKNITCCFHYHIQLNNLFPLQDYLYM